MKDNFNFFVPISFEKGSKKGKETMRIKGIASTSQKDSEDEILEPSGYDLSKFLKYGFINYNHLSKADPSKIIGEPDKAYVKDGNFHIEGELYNDNPLAKSVYDLAKTLEKRGSSRKLGYSIEGKALERDPINNKRITKALITGVAVTPTPINSNTFLEICKGEQVEDFQDYNYGKADNKEAEGGEGYILDVTNPEDGMRYMIRKDFSIKVHKAINTENASAVIKEDVEGTDVKVLDYKIKKAATIVYLAHKNGKISDDILKKCKNNINDIKFQ